MTRTHLTTAWIASLLAACGPREVNPQGLWEGSVTAEDGSTTELWFTVGEEWEYRTLVAFESARWRVYDAEGHVEGWFAFEGGLFHCVDGPCRINRSGADQPHSMPVVEQGGFHVRGRVPGMLPDWCLLPHDFDPALVILDMQPVTRVQGTPTSTGSGMVGDSMACSPTVDGPAVLELVDPGWE
jgi:hypothetical protein